MDNTYNGAWAEPKPTDWVATGETGITYEEVVKDWKEYLPTQERQRNNLFDSNMCVTYSGLNTLETQLVRLMKKGLLPQTHVDFLTAEGYLDENGRPNFNEVFCAKLNGTTIAGNHLGAFWDGIRKHGAIPQQDWLDISTANSWDSLMEAIPDALLAKGKRFKEMFEINYEWVLLGTVRPDVLDYQVRHAPLHIVSPTCGGWNTGKVEVCPGTAISHATMIYGADWGINLWDFDHYAPYEKTLDWQYYVPYAIKGIIKPKEVIHTIPKPIHTFAHNLKMGEQNDEIKALQEALRYLGYFKYPIATGYYGRITADAVRAFQYRYQVASPEELLAVDGKNVGPKTRAQLNLLLA